MTVYQCVQHFAYVSFGWGKQFEVVVRVVSPNDDVMTSV